MSEPAPQSQLSSQEFCKPTVNTIGRWKLDIVGIFTLQKLANATNQGCVLQRTSLSAQLSTLNIPSCSVKHTMKIFGSEWDMWWWVERGKEDKRFKKSEI